MTDTALQLRDQLACLPREERAELAHFLIDTLDEGIDANDDPAWEAELLRREAEIRNGTAKGIPAEKVMTEMREKYS